MKKISSLCLIVIFNIVFISFGTFASNIITVDEVMYDVEMEGNGVNAGTFYWDANGVITLDNYDGGSIRGEGDLIVVLKGDNKITCSSGETYGVSTRLGNLTIEGNGKLTIDATEKSVWCSAIGISVDNEDKSITIKGVSIIANGAFAGIEGYVEDYDRNGETKSAFLNIKNSDVDLNGTIAAFICGKDANIKISDSKITEPNGVHIVDFYFDNAKFAKVFSNNKEDMILLKSEYDANHNIDDLNVFLKDYGMINNIIINKQLIFKALVLVFFVIGIVFFIKFYILKKTKKEKNDEILI